ncbi:hypothetical protein [Leuconostoc palmae]|uniref:hypothetical protein n=1 Tax=Leuconostoc palmae TaxID=501487 RepID=UPI001C7CCA52|nr:hypothetical protein [Leuconostoc palmae]
MPENKLNVAIVGATGYGGLELLRLLYNHPNVNVSSIHHTSESQDDINQLFPHLKKMYKITFSPFNPNNIMQTAVLLY